MRTARRSTERLEPQQLRWLDIAYGSCQRMHASVGKILTYSRNDAHPISDGIAELDLALDKAVVNLASDLERIQGVIVCGTVPSLRFTHVQFVQVVQNLIGNALVKPKNVAPRTAIAAHRQAMYVEISITHNVAGIPAFQLSQIGCLGRFDELATIVGLSVDVDSVL